MKKSSNFKVLTNGDAAKYFAIALKHAMVVKQTTQRDLALVAGVSQQTISKMLAEDGGSEAARKRIAKFYKFDYSYFILLGMYLERVAEKISKGKVPNGEAI